MSKYELLYQYMKNNNGMISIQNAKELGVHRQYLYNLVQRGEIEKVGRGMFVDVHQFQDRLYAVQMRYRKGVYSHLTALYLHDLTDRTPLKYTMTFPTDYNVSNVKEAGVDVYRSKRENYNLSVVTVVTNQGHEVRCYSAEKTLCDIVRGNNRVDKELVVEAFRRYSKKNNKDISLLLSCAKKLKVESIVKTYMEVLL